jgi:hypothetical protein
MAWFGNIDMMTMENGQHADGNPGRPILSIVSSSLAALANFSKMPGSTRRFQKRMMIRTVTWSAAWSRAASDQPCHLIKKSLSRATPT